MVIAFFILLIKDKMALLKKAPQPYKEGLTTLVLTATLYYFYLNDLFAPKIMKTRCWFAPEFHCKLLSQM